MRCNKCGSVIGNEQEYQMISEGVMQEVNDGKNKVLNQKHKKSIILCSKHKIKTE